jgi:hypothetical protein
VAAIGIILRLYHTGKAGDSVLISDLGDGTDSSDFRKVGPVYVPRDDPGYVDLTYSTDVALSYRDRGIRKFIDGGYLRAEFFFGPLAQQAAVGQVFVTTTPYDARVGDREILVCTVGSPVTIQLPPIADHQTGHVFIFDARGTASVNNITVLPAPGDTINGGASATISSNHGFLDLYSDCVSDWTPLAGGAGVSDHTLLLNLPWTSSGHTGPVNTLAGFDGAGAATTYPAPSGRTDYGTLATNPAGVPNDGDIYYNSSLQMEMRYDAFRSKWLSIESTEFIFRRDGNNAPGQYYRTADGRVMSATLGWYAVRSGTIVSLGYTRTDADAASAEITANGGTIASVASAATGGRDITLNADFTFGQVLAARNAAAGNTTSNFVGWIRVKWRV